MQSLLFYLLLLEPASTELILVQTKDGQTNLTEYADDGKRFKNVSLNQSETTKHPRELFAMENVYRLSWWWVFVWVGRFFRYCCVANKLPITSWQYYHQEMCFC